MFDYKFELEKGSKKYACPGCGAPKKFKRYVMTATREYVGAEYGRCDRENSCGYHRRPSSQPVAVDLARFYSAQAGQRLCFTNARAERSTRDSGLYSFQPFKADSYG